MIKRLTGDATTRYAGPSTFFVTYGLACSPMRLAGIGEARQPTGGKRCRTPRLP
jgi:hypothetical protein